jgi:molybdenum cofactor cytidylyltransferase
MSKEASMDDSNSTPLPVAGVILAAGAASRMGQPKLLLPWKGEALIRHSARAALDAGLQPVVVVTGAGAEALTAALAGLAVQTVHNPDWAAGQSTSVRAGIAALPAATPAVLFLLGDQPFLSVELIRRMVETYRQTRPAILAPFVNGKRSNPVLFDRAVFDEMRQLQGDVGARSLFAQHPPAALPWPDERLLLDVDTPEDYRRLTEE